MAVVLCRLRSAPNVKCLSRRFVTTCQTLDIIYADAGLVVVNKPSGFLSVPGIGEMKQKNNVATVLQEWFTMADAEWKLRQISTPSAFETIEQLKSVKSFPEAKLDIDAVKGSHRRRKERKKALQEGLLPFVATRELLANDKPAEDAYKVYPRVVHRLDEATSGVLVFALTAALHRALSIQFISRCISKEYEAIVDTRAAAALQSPLCNADSGIIQTSLQSASHKPLLREMGGGAAENAIDALECQTEWRVLERNDNTVRLALHPITGRTHQLRLHCALPPPYGLGAPIVGDVFYGDPRYCLESYALQLQGSTETAAGDWQTMATLVKRTLETLERVSLPASGEPGRLHLHAKAISIVDYFNYAANALAGQQATLMRSSEAGSGSSSDRSWSVREGFTVSFRPSDVAVSRTVARVDERADGYTRERGVVRIATARMPF